MLHLDFYLQFHKPYRNRNMPRILQGMLGLIHVTFFFL